jgi:hypothetical protein
MKIAGNTSLLVVVAAFSIAFAEGQEARSPYASGEGRVPISFGSSYLIGVAITGAPIPWQQLVEPLRGILGDAGEHVGEPGQRIDVIELCRHDQCSHDGRAIGAAL